MDELEPIRLLLRAAAMLVDQITSREAITTHQQAVCDAATELEAKHQLDQVES